MGDYDVMILKWLFSSTVRDAGQMRKHVHKILSAQSDLLSEQAVAAVQKAMDALRETCATGDKHAVRASMTGLESAANKWFKPYPNHGLRENIEVLLVAVAVAMAIRTFYLQPFKIPTGSMQPTLYGITQEDLSGQSTAQIPNRVARFFEYWINGVSYFREVAKNDGVLSVGAPQRFVLFNLKQSYKVGDGPTQTIWFPPDGLFERARLATGQPIHAGEEFLKLKVISGDHLFVDRVSYNFRTPDRGDIVVFKTEGIVHPQVPQDQFYIKRLVALGGEKVQIGRDHRLVINGQPLTSSTPHFQALYTFGAAVPPSSQKENHYVGHIHVDSQQNELAKGFFVDGELKDFPVRPNHLLVMGDNTRSSLDSRYWGDFSSDNVIGKSFFVYWPIGRTTYKGEERPSRFGWSQR